MERTPQAIIYCRVSTLAQAEEGTSLETQEARCHEHAAAAGYAVIGVFRDAYSGTHYRHRPALSTLREQVRTGNVDVLLAYSVDRLSRNQAHLYILAEEAEEHGARLEFVTESFEDSAVGRFIRSTHAFAAEIENEKRVERSLRGKLARVQSGKFPNMGRDLYGYRKDREQGVFNVCEDEAEVVRMVFSWVGEELLPIREVIRRLNERGISSPGARFAKPDRPAPRWAKGVLHRMLRNTTYKGEAYAWRWQHNGKNHMASLRPKNEWVPMPGVAPAIVDVALWDAVQRRLDTNQGDAKRNEARPYLLRGHIRCPICGRRLYASPERARRIYRCSSRETRDGACGATRVPAEEVESWLWERISQILGHGDVIAAQVQARRAAARTLDSWRTSTPPAETSPAWSGRLKSSYRAI